MDPENKKRLKYLLIFLFCAVLFYFIYNANASASALEQAGGALPDPNLIQIRECNKIIEALLKSA